MVVPEVEASGRFQVRKLTETGRVSESSQHIAQAQRVTLG